MPTSSWFYILLRSRRRHEPSSRPLGRLSLSEVEAGGHDSGRSKRKGLPRVKKRTARREEHSEIQPCDGTILDILQIFIILPVLTVVNPMYIIPAEITANTRSVMSSTNGRSTATTGSILHHELTKYCEHGHSWYI